MKRVRVVGIAVVAVLMVASLAQLGIAAPPGEAGGNSGYIRRFAANFDTFGTPPELVTNLPPAPGAQGGLVIYDKRFFHAADINTVYVQISATGDTHAGAKMLLACEYDGQPCNAGANPVATAPPGWVTVMRHKDYNRGDFQLGPTPFIGDGGGGAGDMHDNVVAYTWCTRANGAGWHNVKIKLASLADVADGATQEESTAFLEAVHFFVDGSRIANPELACVHDT